MDITDNFGTTVKVGDIIRNRTSVGRASFQVFSEVFGDWFGTVIFLEAGMKYYHLHVLLSSHGGMMCDTWLTADEIREHIEVVHGSR